MMTTELFEQLISRDESDTLDFKKEQYEFVDDDSVAKFVKDILSFANTIRKHNSYIIIGIEQTTSGKIFHGLSKNIDDAIFQDKVKTKVYPIPKFSYSVFRHNSLDYGIIEVPLQRYSETLAPIVKMKGLEVGKVYIRRGSTNSEAIGKEVTQIDKWIQTVEVDIDLKREIESLVHEINAAQSILSACVSKALKIANSTSDKELIRFCKGELMGWYGDNVDLNQDNLPSHRKTKVMASMYQINNISIPKGTSFNLTQELKKDKKFREIDFLIQDSLSQIETTLREYQQHGYITINRKLGDIAPDAPVADVPIFIYTQKDTFQVIYDRTKIQLIRHLIKLME